MKNLIQVVAADDRLENLMALEAILQSSNYQLVLLNSGNEVLQYMQQNPETVAVLLLDVQMPGLDGFQTLAKLRKIKGAEDIPVIFLTAIDSSPAHIDLAYETGAVDFLFKPFQPNILASKVAFFVQHFNSQKQLKLLQAEKIAAAVKAESEAKMNVVTSAAPILISYIDQNQKYRFANQTYEKWFGRKNSEILGHTAAEVVGQEQAQSLLPYMKRGLGGETVKFEAFLQLSSLGQRCIEFTYVPEFSTDQKTVLGIVSVGMDITDLKNTQASLKETSKKLEVLIQGAPLPIVLMDLDSTVEMWNPAAEKLYGWTAEEIRGRPFPVIPEFRKSDFLAKMANFGKGLIFSGLESTHQNKKGELLSVAFWAVPIENFKGQTQCLTLITDMSAMKTAQENLRQSRDQLNIILDGVTDGIVVSNSKQRFIYANQMGARQCGFSSVEELLDCPIEEVLNRVELSDEDGNSISEDQLPSHRASAGKTLLPEKILKFHNKKTGAISWCTINSKPVYDKNGQIGMVINFIRDLTERKISEDHQKFISQAALALSSSLDFRTTIRNVAQLAVPQIADWCAVHMFTEDGSVDQLAVAHSEPSKASRAQEFMLQYPPDLARPQGLGKVMLTGKSELLSHISDDMLVASARDSKHLELMRSLGFTSLLAVPLLGRNRTLGAITFVSAESGRHFNEADLKLAEALAARAALAIENSNLYRESQEINQVKDEFLATLSHELRTPLNIIQGHAELLLMEVDRLSDPDMVTSIQAIDRNAKLQTQIIADLLDVSSIVTGKMSYEPVLLKPQRVLENIAETAVKTAAAKGVQLKVSGSSDSSLISADPTRLHQILWNLVSNAIKFTPAGGEVSIHSFPENQNFIFEVKDTGLGITPEFLPHVFDRFRQEDSSRTRKFGGLGLGLSIVRNLVELHGGKVSASSSGKDQGSLFRVQLPLAQSNPITSESFLV